MERAFVIFGLSIGAGMIGAAIVATQNGDYERVASLSFCGGFISIIVGVATVLMRKL